MEKIDWFQIVRKVEAVLPPADDIISMDDAARLLGVRVTTLGYWMNTGVLPTLVKAHQVEMERPQRFTSRAAVLRLKADRQLVLSISFTRRSENSLNVAALPSSLIPRISPPAAGVGAN